MSETLTHDNMEFTFERVQSISELPWDYAFYLTTDHETALKAWRPEHSRHILYYNQKSTKGRIYAFTKATE